MAEIHTLLRSYYHQDIHSIQVHANLRWRFYPIKTPAYTHLSWSMVSVIRLDPSILGAHDLNE